MPPPKLVMQTTYAELLERCATTAFNAPFPEDGVFTKKTVKGRRYWYFQTPTDDGRRQKYVGPETPELLERITRYKETRDDQRERRALVSTLVRSFRLPRPKPEIGNALESLATAGAFRLRGVLVGTLAYQTYAGILGVILPNPTLQTDDIDIAQFENISVAVEDKTSSAIDILRRADKSFRPVPTTHRGHITSYVSKNGLRVEFLTPNLGPETDAPKPLPALQTDAQPLRFLDFLIHEPDRAVILHGAGVLVLVPSPERYAVHKLIISRRRKRDSVKRDKDIRQAEVLLEILAEKRPYELAEMWNEAFERGPGWRQPLTESMMELAPPVRETTLKLANKTRSILPRIELTFDDQPASYDFNRDTVVFHGHTSGSSVECAISRAALDDNFGTDHLGNEGRLRAFHENRGIIEGWARAKYLSWPIEEPEAVLIKTSDIAKLREKATP